MSEIEPRAILYSFKLSQALQNSGGFFFGGGRWVIPYNALGLPLVFHLGLTSGSAQGLNEVLGIECASAMHKASTSPTVLSLWCPQNNVLTHWHAPLIAHTWIWFNQ